MDPIYVHKSLVSLNTYPVIHIIKAISKSSPWAYVLLEHTFDLFQSLNYEENENVYKLTMAHDKSQVG